MEFEPKKYQERTIEKMLSQGSVGEFIDPGLGKTIISLVAFQILKDEGYAKKMLVVAPLRPMYTTWPAEIEKWDIVNNLDYVIVHGKEKAEALELEADVYLINPEGLLWLFDERHRRWEKHSFDVLCIDESTKFKHSNTRRFKALRKRIPDFQRRWILTGTPIPNGVADLFGQMYILDLGSSLGKYVTHFRNEFMEQSNPYIPYSWTPRAGAFDTVIKRIDPLIVQLNAEDYLDMPKIIRTFREVELDAESLIQYRQIEDHFITQIREQVIVASNAAAAGTKCRQIANGAVYLEGGEEWVLVHNQKLDALEEILEELNGEPCLILYEYHHDRDRILERFGDLPSLTGVSPTKIQETILRFNAGDYPAIISYAGSTHGINIQAKCRHIVWFGITWNLEYYDQTNRRVYRQGQPSDKVFFHHIIAKDTLDSTVVQVLGQKDRTQKTLLSALSGV